MRGTNWINQRSYSIYLWFCLRDLEVKKINFQLFGTEHISATEKAGRVVFTAQNVHAASEVLIITSMYEICSTSKCKYRRNYIGFIWENNEQNNLSGFFFLPICIQLIVLKYSDVIFCQSLRNCLLLMFLKLHDKLLCVFILMS